jgi:hypothetical protein
LIGFSHTEILKKKFLISRIDQDFFNSAHAWTINPHSIWINLKLSFKLKNIKSFKSSPIIWWIMPVYIFFYFFVINLTYDTSWTQPMAFIQSKEELVLLRPGLNLSNESIRFYSRIFVACVHVYSGHHLTVS